MSRHMRLQKTLRSPSRQARRKNKPLAEERQRVDKAFQQGDRKTLDGLFRLTRNIIIKKPKGPRDYDLPAPKG